MLMRMLEAGGLPPLTDVIREADDDNPRGYYEFERVKGLPNDTEWLEEAQGKAIKVLAELIKYLPETHFYRIIFIERSLDEVIASQRKMLIRRGEDPDKVSEKELRMLFEKYLRILKNHLRKQSNMSVIYVSYNEIIRDPGEIVQKVNAFLGGELDEGSMISSIDPALYRNRSL